MKKCFKTPLLWIVGLGLAVSLLLSPLAGMAATPNQALTDDVELIPFQISGQWTASTAAVAKIKLPFPAKLIGVSATARASGGTSPTLTADVQEGGVSVLAAPVAITAGAVTEATITDSALADESLISVDLAIGGTLPTWNDITVLLTVRRR